MVALISVTNLEGVDEGGFGLEKRESQWPLVTHTYFGSVGLIDEIMAT